MPIETNLNTSPYFDDYDQNKDFYKVLFKPGVALQARELTQLQSILQKQVERFGDNIFKSGTVISGLNFEFIERYDYVKILDTEVGGAPVAVNSYLNYFVKNSANLVARVVNVREGFQSRDPETNYLYLKYINSGNTDDIFSYSNSDVLTVYNNNYELFSFDVNNGGSGFSNSDTVVITSAVVVSTSNVAAGANVNQIVGSISANLYVSEVNTTFGSITLDGTTYSNTAGYQILKLRPNDTDLANTNQPTNRYTFTDGYTITQGSNTASVVATIGSGATALITTDAAGVISTTTLINGGSAYEITPSVRVRSSTGVLTNIDIVPNNFKARLTIAGDTFNASGTKPVGNGYAFSVTEGVVYQKGHFLRVEPQTIIVNAYSSAPDGVTVGLYAKESVVNSNVDDTLLDLALGSPNYTAPGADRLKIEPLLFVANTSDVEGSALLPLVEFREGEPYKQSQTTVYNNIAYEQERRTLETSGNFVIDPFLITTKDQTTWSNTYLNVAVDPGLAYIDGKRVQTNRNTFVPIRRSNNTRTLTTQTLSLNYGNYIYVNEVAGYFDTKSGATVSLRDTARTIITLQDTNVANTSYGANIGSAKIRSLVLDTGIPGTNTAVYRAYLFDVRLNAGIGFNDVKSIHYDGTNKGVADIVQTISPTTGLLSTQLVDRALSSLVFQTGNKAVRAANNIDYVYRTAETTATMSINGTVQVTTGDFISFGNNATASATQRRDLILTLKEEAISSNVITTARVVQSYATVNAVALVNKFKVGDFVKVTSDANSAQTMVSQILSINNANNITLANTWTFSTINDGTVARYIPANTPIPLDESRVSANVNSTGKTLTINISNTSNDFITDSPKDAIVVYNARKSNAEEEHRNTKRGILVKIDIANHPAANNGPWCLGVPDAFRLNKVYMATSSVVNTNSTDVTENFYINTGQFNDYYGHSHLTLLPSLVKSFPLPDTNWLLAEFDAYTLDSATSAGFFTVESFDLAQNNSSRAELGNTAVNILEIPEYKASNGQIIDLRDCIDFRPRVVATANVTSTLSLATTNPANTINLGTHDKLFPVPDSEFDYDYEYYLRRTDRVVVDENSTISIVEGTPSTSKLAPNEPPTGTLTLGVIDVAPYPSFPIIPDVNQINIGVKKVGTDNPIYNRYSTNLVAEIGGISRASLQPRRYTMADVGKLERRLENVEYYVNMSQLEQRTKDLSIPSEIDPARNRFKNGFFVDSFENYIQADTGSAQFYCEINQEEGILQPPISTTNFKARFNMADATTRANALNEDGINEPGVGQWGESVITLPVVEEFALINQSAFTSAVSGDGTSTKFVGDMTIKPNKFHVTAKVEVRLTGDDAGTPPPPPPAAPSSGRKDSSGGSSGGSSGKNWFPVVAGAVIGYAVKKAVVGAAVGAGVGLLAVLKVICGKLYRLGYLPRDVFLADQAYGAKMLKEDPMAYEGYRLWADTVVDWMDGKGPDFMYWIKDNKERARKQQEFVIRMVRTIASSWAYHLAFKQGVVERDNILGKITLNVGVPICRAIGYINRKFNINMNSNSKGFIILGTFIPFYYSLKIFRGK